MFGIDVPILAFSHCRDVVAAVTKAGGLGVLGATAHTPDALAVDLAWIRDEVNGSPFGVDVLLPVKHADQGAKASAIPAEQLAFVNKLLTDRGMEPIVDDPADRASGPAFGELVDPVAF